MKSVLFHFMILLFATITFASTPKDDAEIIHIQSRIEDMKDDFTPTGEVKDITGLGNHLLALTGKETQMPKAFKDPLIKKRAFHLCRSHGFAGVDAKTTRTFSPVAHEKDFKVVQWVEGNLHSVSAAKTTHWSTTNDNGKGRHEVSGPFELFTQLKCVR